MSRASARAIKFAAVGLALLTVASWFADDLADFALWAWRERWNKQ